MDGCLALKGFAAHVDSLKEANDTYELVISEKMASSSNAILVYRDKTSSWMKVSQVHNGKDAGLVLLDIMLKEIISSYAFYVFILSDFGVDKTTCIAHIMEVGYTLCEMIKSSSWSHIQASTSRKHDDQDSLPSNRSNSSPHGTIVIDAECQNSDKMNIIDLTDNDKNQISRSDRRSDAVEQKSNKLTFDNIRESKLFKKVEKNKNSPMLTMNPNLGSVGKSGRRRRKQNEWIKCDFPGCYRYFVSHIAHVGHIRQIHTQERPFECHLCKGRYSMQRYLVDHLRRVHSHPSRKKRLLMKK